MFFNGTEVDSDTTKEERSYPTGDGRIVVGRIFTDQDAYYGSVQVDELIYFDAVLKDSDIQSIYDSA